MHLAIVDSSVRGMPVVIGVEHALIEDFIKFFDGGDIITSVWV